MPVITAGLYKVVFTQLYADQECLNVFWYRHATGSDVAGQALWDAFDQNVVPSIATLQIDAVTYTNLLVLPIFGTGTEISGQLITATQGGHANTTNRLAVFACSSIRLLRTTNETRSGWKRFTGLEEADIIDALGHFSTAYNILLDATANVIADNLGIANEFVPVIVRRPGVYGGVEQTGWVRNDIQGAIGLDRLTTQNSRKPF